jgi:hypothetical protein
MSSIRANTAKQAKRKRSSKRNESYTASGNVLDADFVDTSDDEMIADFAEEEVALHRTQPADEDDYGGAGYGIAPHHDLTNLTLKADADRRPLWICPDGHVFLEVRAFSSAARYLPAWSSHGVRCQTFRVDIRHCGVC